MAILLLVLTVKTFFSASPFLLGRCLWIGSKFPDQLAPAAMSTFLQATVAALQPSQMPVVRIAAARAVWGFCSHLKQNKRTSSIDLVRFETLVVFVHKWLHISHVFSNTVKPVLMTNCQQRPVYPGPKLKLASHHRLQTTTTFGGVPRVAVVHRLNCT